MNDQFQTDCLTCQALQEKIRLTDAPPVIETGLWKVEHAYPTSVRGWLVLVPKRHCEAMHQLTAAELSELVRLLGLCSRALAEVQGAKKEYLMQFAEQTGFHHVHFHLVARMPDWPANLTGPLVMSALGDRVRHPLPQEEVIPLAVELREWVTERWQG
jgi:diadenosine tetraphosphate (Ap4A) HIT family hydrolase